MTLEEVLAIIDDKAISRNVDLNTQGMMPVGIPEYRLPRDILKDITRRLDDLPRHS